MTRYLSGHKCDFGPYDNQQCSCGESAFVFALGAMTPAKKYDPVIGRVTKVHDDGMVTIELNSSGSGYGDVEL